MDGPNVNWKLIQLLKDKKKELDPEAPDLLELGSCRVHVMHGAFNTASGVTNWELAKYLKGCYFVFKKSPARRSDYLEVNDLLESHLGRDSSYLFPLKYCGHRWMKNTKAITRVKEISDHLQASKK